MQSSGPGMQNHRRPMLVGRDKERVFLREEMVEAFAGRGRLVLVGGEAGIGKTTLVRDLLQDDDANAGIKLAGQCYDLTNTPPYGPWLDLFAGYMPNDGLPGPPLAFAGGRLDRISDQAELYADLRAFLIELSARRPLLVLLEDLHWSDPASLELLRHIGSHIGGLAVLILITYRIDELARTTPFYQQLPTLIRESHGLRLDLRGLSPDELIMLVRSRWQLPGPDEQRLVRYLIEHADGNPFFATEILRGLEEEGLIEAGADGFVAELDQLMVPSLLRQVIENRVDRLGSEARSCLAVASVIGQDVPLDLWSNVARIAPDAILDLVDRGVQANVLEAGRSGTHVTFVHALTRAALYEGLIPPRRREWHKRIANELIAAGSSGLDAVAYHLVQAGDDRATEWLILAGDRAQRSYAWLTAQERFAEAATLLEAIPGQEQARGWLLFRLARLQRYAGGDAPVTALDESRRLGIQTGDVLLASDSLYSRGVHFAFSGDFAQGLEQIAAGIQELEKQLETVTQIDRERVPWMADSLPQLVELEEHGVDPAIEALKHAGMHHRRGALPWFLTLAGRSAEGEAIGAEFIAVVEAASTMGNWVRSGSGHSHQGVAGALAISGQPVEARIFFERGRQIYASIDHHAVIAFSLLTELRDCAIPFETRNVERRRELGAAATAALGRAGGSFPPGLSPDLATLSIHFLAGGWDVACAITAGGDITGPVIIRRQVTTTMAAIARAQGRFEDAWDCVFRALPKGVNSVPGSTLYRESTELLLLAADLSMDAGNLDGAREWLGAHDSWLRWSGAVLGKAEGLTAWTRYFHAVGEEHQSLRAAADALAAASDPDQPLALIAAARALADIQTATHLFDAAASNLQEALELSIACELPYEEALTRASLAELNCVTDDLNGMEEQIRQARLIADQLDARPLIERLAHIPTERAAPIDDHPAGLTPRELEVLRLVTQGMTDAAVGEKLFISTRTVSQHLRSIYSKFNVSSRASATRIAVEKRLV